MVVNSNTVRNDFYVICFLCFNTPPKSALKTRRLNTSDTICKKFINYLKTNNLFSLKQRFLRDEDRAKFLALDFQIPGHQRDRGRPELKSTK